MIVQLVLAYQTFTHSLNLDSAVERVLFLTQRRREKSVFMFFESYFHFCNTIQATPNWRRFNLSEKFLYFPFPRRTSLFLCITLHLCDSALKSTAVFRLNLKSAVQRRKHLAEARGVRVTATAFSRINGGDREKLIPANNLVSNYDIHHSAKFHRTYAPAIGIGGCGQRVVGCRLPRTP